MCFRCALLDRRVLECVLGPLAQGLVIGVGGRSGGGSSGHRCYRRADHDQDENLHLLPLAKPPHQEAPFDQRNAGGASRLPIRRSVAVSQSQRNQREGKEPLDCRCGEGARLPAAPYATAKVARPKPESLDPLRPINTPIRLASCWPSGPTGRAVTARVIRRRTAWSC
jgi:hypothetical protein